MPVESNPPGDIPDNIQYIPYTSKAGHFTLTLPEGWSRSTASSMVTFTDNKLNVVTVAWSPASSAPTTSTARTTDVPRLRQTERAFQLGDIKSVSLPAGPAVLITFTENSAPDQVTGKQYRLDVQRFEFFHNGEEAVLTLSSPVGRDNVDPWRLISESFRWK
ncbi:MAG: hypothetical protein M3Q23_15255 [Actinomycetota bacterium]|nr:hypothetical protein [Actinomycetota bacterium]